MNSEEREAARELVELAQGMLVQIEGEWGRCRGYHELVSVGDADAVVIERVRGFLDEVAATE